MMLRTLETTVRCHFSTRNLFLFVLCIMVSSSQGLANAASSSTPPIVYTIAGSDSGGGAGIQADLHAIQALGCHGCSAITCLTAQNSVAVTAVHTPPVSFLLEQLDALLSDLPPVAIKVGMLATRELAETVGGFLQRLRNNSKSNVFVVLDPVMISTSGSRLLDDDAQTALITAVFPHVDLITPNKYEAEALWGRKIESDADAQEAARYLLGLMGEGKTVMIKGGHSSDVTMASDYLLSNIPSENDEARLCDCSDGGLWLHTPRRDTIHTHGTGCTLSASIAAAMALRRTATNGAYAAMTVVDACCLAKAYVTAGIAQAVPLGQGPGPVAQTSSEQSLLAPYFPSLTPGAATTLPPFRSMQRPSSSSSADTIGRLLPIVDSKEWVARLCRIAAAASIRDIQLRIKDNAILSDSTKLHQIVQECQDLCATAGVRLWINDHWQAAVAAGCYGVHLGQEDLYRALMQPNSEFVQKSQDMALGVSTHSFGELAAALAVRPSYISLGPIQATGSKRVAFAPQGMDVLATWRRLVAEDIPLVAIGGLQDATDCARAHRAGADCAAVIGAITQHNTDEDSIVREARELNAAMGGEERVVKD